MAAWSCRVVDWVGSMPWWRACWSQEIESEEGLRLEEPWTASSSDLTSLTNHLLKLNHLPAAA